MQNILISILLTCLLLGLACKDNKDNSTHTNELPQTTIDTVIQTSKPELLMVYSWVDKLRLREEPNTKSAVIKELKEGEELKFTGKKSDFTQKISLRGQLYDEPWLEVETHDGKIGWAFGGGVKFYKPSVDAKSSPYDACMAMLAKDRLEQHEKCCSSVQERQLKKDKTIIRKTSEGHEIKLLDGTIQELANQNPTETDSSFIIYQYRYYIPNMGFYVFKKENSEDGISYTLINDKSGKETSIKAYPKPAPDGKHLLCLHNGKENDEPLGFEIMGFTKNGFQQVYSQAAPEKYYPTQPKWMDGENMELTLQPFEDDGFYVPKTVRLKLEDGNWKPTEKK